MKILLLTVPLSLSLACSLFSCAQTSPDTSDSKTEKIVMMNNLSQKLESTDYIQLFMTEKSAPDYFKDFIKPYSTLNLAEVIEENPESSKASFIAAELLFNLDYDILGKISKEKLAEIYAQALINNNGDCSNIWGMPFYSDFMGLAGVRFLYFDKEAISPLKKLLSDTTLVQSYIGSEEATVGNRAEYKVKEFAAFYLARILTLNINQETESKKVRKTLVKKIEKELKLMEKDGRENK